MTGRPGDRNRICDLIGELKPVSKTPVKTPAVVHLVMYWEAAEGEIHTDAPGYIICRTPAAVAYLRARLAELIAEVDGCVVVEDIEDIEAGDVGESAGAG